VILVTEQSPSVSSGLESGLAPPVGSAPREVE
jgi:hypothetical protein